MKKLVATPATAMILLWGAGGTGKTHLLLAACQAVAARSGQAGYLSFKQVDALAPAVLDGLEALELVCLDDIEWLPGHPAWEQALFHLHNRLRGAGRALLVAGRLSPSALPLGLADLKSRLQGALTFHLRDLDDDEKALALRRRAQARGFELPEEVAEYLLKRIPRDMTALCEWLERLDQASWTAQRKLTIPFVKSVLK